MRGSWGVSPTGTTEPNPPAPAGRIKPTINNGGGGIGHLWLRTKQCLDRNTNGFSNLTDSTFFPLTKLSQVFLCRLPSKSNILRAVTCRIILSPSLFKWSLQLKACARISFPFKIRPKKKTLVHILTQFICYYSHFSHRLNLHIAARHDPLLVLLH